MHWVAELSTLAICCGSSPQCEVAPEFGREGLLVQEQKLMFFIALKFELEHWVVLAGKEEPPRKVPEGPWVLNFPKGGGGSSIRGIRPRRLRPNCEP